MTALQQVKHFNSLGQPLCIRWNPDYGEFIVYPRGGSTLDDSAFFTNDAQDAINTAWAVIEQMEVAR
jgi:hypothetical protein